MITITAVAFTNSVLDGKEGNAMSFLDRLFEKAKPARGKNDAPRSPVRTFGGARSVVSYGNVVAADAALEHPIIYRCLNKIASSVQTVGWYCEEDPEVPRGERAGALTIKAINSVLASPNDSLAPDQLKFWMALNYAVFGRIGFKVGVSSVSGFANGLYPLDARFLKAIPNDRGVTTQFEYGNLQEKQTLMTRRSSEESETKYQPYAHEIYTPSLAGSIGTASSYNRNINALAAIGMPSMVIKLLLERAFDTATGHFNSKYIITGEKTITKPQKKAMEEHIEEGAAGGEESGKVLFLDGTSVKIDKLDNDLSDIHSKIPLDDMSRMIGGAFGIPIALLGIGGADAAKFAGNYAESRMTFWADTITPCYLVPIEVGLTAAICPYGARIRFDRDSIDALADSRIQRAKNLTSVNFLTTTEKRELCGYGPSDKFPEVIAAVKPVVEPTEPKED
jgi:phage portal protein BeeE